MATRVQHEHIGNEIIIDVENDSDDEYTLETLDYEMVVTEEKAEEYQDVTVQTEQYNKILSGEVSVETVEEDDDEYTYEEEILEVVMEEKDADMDSTVDPPPLPGYRNSAIGPSRSTNLSPSNNPTKASQLKPPPPTMVPSSPVIQTQRRTIPFFAPSYATLKESPFPSTPSFNVTPSMQRVKAANSAGLSELSKQLRILQAKNESQNVEINRLERQLRILADLQGISVNDLRKALEDACASEAFEELQNRVLKLKYDLEAATMAKKAELRKDEAAPHIANLELRVGELEEVEEKQMREIRVLYDALRKEKTGSTQLESENQQLKGALQSMVDRLQNETARAAQVESSFQKQLEEMRERQSKLMAEAAERQISAGKPMKKGTNKNANPSYMVSPEMAAEYKQMVQLLKKKDEELQKARAKLHADELRGAEKLKDAEERARQKQMDMQVEAEKLALTVKELEDADGQNGLRLAQFKARFTVQEERVVDMGQQLDSLYTAFELVKDEEDSERVAMLNNLKDADAEIARQAKKKQEKTTKSRRQSNHGFPPSPYADRSSVASVPYFVEQYVEASPGVANRRPDIAMRAPVSPATSLTSRSYHGSTRYSNNTPDRNSDFGRTPSSTSRRHSNPSMDYYDTPTTYATAQAFHPSPERTPSTWELLRNKDTRNRSGVGDLNHTQEMLIVGSLILETNGMLRKWKTKPSRIYMRGDGYQWDIGEKRSFPLRFGVSKVEFHPNYPLSFAVSLDPTSPNAPTIRCAASNEHDYHLWMTALTKATTGEVYRGNIESSDTPASNPSVPIASSSVDEAEDDDLKRILELSKYET